MGRGVATAEAQEQRAYTVEGESERCQQQEKKVRLGIQWGMDLDSPEYAVWSQQTAAVPLHNKVASLQ